MTNYQTQFKMWVNEEKIAVNILKSVGKLMYEKGVELVFFRKHLIDINVLQLMSLFHYARNVIEKEVSINDVENVVNEICLMDLAPAKLDIALLTSEYSDSKSNNLSEFLNEKLANFIGEDNHDLVAKDIVLYGFGRIGRLVARELIRQAGKGQQLRLKAIVTRKVNKDQIEKRASLFKNDSVHGKFNGIVDIDYNNNYLIINGQSVKMIPANNPEEINYTDYGINNALLIDNTGIFNDAKSLSKHLLSKGISKVLLTAPAKEIPNIVYGINNFDLDIINDNIFSAASCTTNAISPILKVINDNYNIMSGHIETIHAYTNDQNLLDNMHKKSRRGRSAAINMVITTTGAGNAVTKVIPSLKNKLTANAVRVPTPNGSLAIMKLKIKSKTSVEQLNSLVKYHSLNGKLTNQIDYQIEDDLVSNDIIGNTCCSVFDSKATIVSNEGTNIVLYTWYDNEFGYTKQVIRLAKQIAQVRRYTYY